MNKLEITDTFECSVQDFWRQYLSFTYMPALDQEVAYKSVQPLATDDNAERTLLRRRLVPPADLPPHIKMALNNSLSMLRQAMVAVNVQTLPEMFRRMIGWAQVAFQDHLEPRDGRRPDIVMSYVEEQVFDKKKQVLRWSITPDLFKDFSAFKGTVRLEPAPEGIRRIIAGEIDLGIPGVGDMVEAWMVQEIGKIFKKGGDLLKKQLKEQEEAKRQAAPGGVPETQAGASAYSGATAANSGASVYSGAPATYTVTPAPPGEASAPTQGGPAATSSPAALSADGASSRGQGGAAASKGPPVPTSEVTGSQR